MTTAEMHDKLATELVLRAMDHQTRVVADVVSGKAFALVAPDCIVMALDFAVLPELQEFCLN